MTYHYLPDGFDVMTCECGVQVKKHSLWNHKKSVKHKYRMEQNIKEIKPIYYMNLIDGKLTQCVFTVD